MSTLDTILRWSPLQLLSSLGSARRLAVLAFHGVDDPEQFEYLMDYVVRNRRPISVDALSDAVHNGTDLPERSVLITFDDGHRSVLESGLPILRERGLPGVAFVVAGLLSTNEDFWWSKVETFMEGGATLPRREGSSAVDVIRHLKHIPNQERVAAVKDLERSSSLSSRSVPQLTADDLKQLESGGIAIGNHTWSHPCLNRCDGPTVRAEIEAANTRLKDALGHQVRWFAYPNGDWDASAERTLIELGYDGAFLFDHRLTSLANPMRLSRVRVNSDSDLDRFALVLSGLHPAIHRARGRA